MEPEHAALWLKAGRGRDVKGKGRPRKQNPRRHVVSVRMNPDELVSVYERAALAGLKLPAFGRAALLGETVATAPALSLAVSPEALHEFRKAAVNLNQLMRLMHTYRLPPPPELPRLLNELRTFFNQAVGDARP